MIDSTNVLLTLMTVLSVSLFIRADYRGARRQVYYFKPLATVLVLGIALRGGGGSPSSYAAAIVLGLAFSLVGDIFLMLPSDRFVYGLTSFLLAHLAYIYAFAWEADLELSVLRALPFVFYAALLLFLLRPQLGRMQAPVLLYSLVLSGMGWIALERWLALGSLPALSTFAGALLFILSDSLLAVNRFLRSFRSAQFFILTTYYLAQWFIAQSV